MVHNQKTDGIWALVFIYRVHWQMHFIFIVVLLIEHRKREERKNREREHEVEMMVGSRIIIPKPHWNVCAHFFSSLYCVNVILPMAQITTTTKCWIYRANRVTVWIQSTLCHTHTYREKESHMQRYTHRVDFVHVIMCLDFSVCIELFGCFAVRIIAIRQCCCAFTAWTSFFFFSFFLCCLFSSSSSFCSSFNFMCVSFLSVCVSGAWVFSYLLLYAYKYKHVNASLRVCVWMCNNSRIYSRHEHQKNTKVNNEKTKELNTWNYRNKHNERTNCRARANQRMKET